MADTDSTAAILSSLSAAYDAVILHDTKASDASRAIGQVTSQPSSFAAQEEQLRTSETWQEHQNYWTSKLRAACCTLDLPRAVNRCKKATDALLSVPINIAKDVWQQVLNVAANESVQPIAVLLTTFQVMTGFTCPGVAPNTLLAIVAIAAVNKIGFDVLERSERRVCLSSRQQVPYIASLTLC